MGVFRGLLIFPVHLQHAARGIQHCPVNKKPAYVQWAPQNPTLLGILSALPHIIAAWSCKEMEMALVCYLKIVSVTDSSVFCISQTPLGSDRAQLLMIC